MAERAAEVAERAAARAALSAAAVPLPVALLVASGMLTGACTFRGGTDVMATSIGSIGGVVGGASDLTCAAAVWRAAELLRPPFASRWLACAAS